MKRSSMILGVVLFLIGIGAVLHPNFSYYKQEQVAKIGPFQATVDQEKTTRIPAGVTASLLGIGLILVLLSSRMKS